MKKLMQFYLEGTSSSQRAWDAAILGAILVMLYLVMRRDG